MKKSKILLVTVLALILCLLCVTTSTFSWFTRPNSQNGDKLVWTNIDYPISNGVAVSVNTYEFDTEKQDYSTEPLTGFTTVTLGSNERKLYRTDIINSGAAVQNVSLFVSSITLGSSGQYIMLGVNGPLKTYKKYGNGSNDKLTDVPIVTNCDVAAAEVIDEQAVNTVESVYWYIKNDSASQITYTINGIYLTL